MDTNRDCHLCTYLSKSLTKEQRNYGTGDRELLAIVQALKEWQHYIQGSEHTTIILSDHNNLRQFKVPQTMDGAWQDGHYISPNLISNWSIYQERRTYKQTHCQDDQIFVQKEQITKHCCFTRTSICQFDQYRATKKNSKYRRYGL